MMVVPSLLLELSGLTCLAISDTCGCVGKLEEKRGVEFTHLDVAAKSINKEVTKSNKGIRQCSLSIAKGSESKERLNVSFYLEFNST